MTRTARVVVGPDEPFEGHSHADMAAGQSGRAGGTLHQHGVEVTAAELQSLRHDVQLSDRVLAPQRSWPWPCRLVEQRDDPLPWL